MSNWRDIQDEMNKAVSDNGPGGVDIIRRQKIKDLSKITGRSTLLYGVEMFNLQKIRATQGDISIDLTDKDGFREALDGISGENLDLIIHSPGGSPEATESIVKLLRQRFDNIRIIVPSVAKSAATMLAMSGDEIILTEDAELGPTDPQMIIDSHAHPAHAILKQFEMAKKEINKSKADMAAWIPILQQYGPSRLVDCKNAIDLSKKLVKEWIAKYMLKGQNHAKRKAAIISRYLSGDKHLSHSRLIDLDTLKRKGVKITFSKEISNQFDEKIKEIYNAMMQTFDRTGAYKIYENHLGRGFYKIIQITVIQKPNQNSK